MDNLFISYWLLSYLRRHSISSISTVRGDRMYGHFSQETLKSNNRKIIDWGEIRTATEYQEGEELVLVIMWQDSAVVRLMSIVHNREGYMIRTR